MTSTHWSFDDELIAGAFSASRWKAAPFAVPSSFVQLPSRLDAST
ncbi:hypothetical protein SAMN05216188_12370 [Lentzea xinjiangensis]|uniref:Uncharacterized protein n=1 Tax=Lentzea xinjiangensis TaxID=402600 RepID=A0A1H9V078_9PSEU|nr:hypothetical protein [Lentzea xinjiangensis]SES14999.1 hypothetical protein SAMN05216188_12370 [Lentzea xinjiangensis]